MNFVDGVVITGAGRGLGRAVAIRCAAEGFAVICIARTSRALETRDLIRSSGGNAESLVLDLADFKAAEEASMRWAQATPLKRLAVVCAAGTLGNAGGIVDGDLESWHNAYAVNVLGNLGVIKGLMPTMLGAKFGRVVTIAGGGAAYAFPRFFGYSLSKTAIVRATENMDAELRGKGDFMTVCLAPGAIETDMLAEVRRAGAEVRTTVKMEEPVEFISRFITARTCGFSGRFVHVRDRWMEWFESAVTGDHWLLRRVEK